MNFLKNFTKHQIFERVAQIANTQIKQKIKSKLESSKQFNSTNTLSSTNDQLIKSSQPFAQPSYDDAEKFMLQLSQSRNKLKIQQMQKRTKKHTFSQLQIDPIYLQSCSINQLFKMELEFGNNGGYQRTQVLHQYLNQVNQTIRKVLFNSGNLEMLQSFVMVQRNLEKIQLMLVKVKLVRALVRNNKENTSRGQKIKNIMVRKVIIKQKLALLHKMKQKLQITLIQPQNLQQIYYSERNRHKLYNKIKGTTITNSYFTMLKSQVLSISMKNAKVIEQYMIRWINKNQQQITQKNIEKLFICLYFVKTQPIYKDNAIEVCLRQLNKENFIKEIQRVKKWKNYQYIQDPAMKGKINQFLNLLVHQVNSIIRQK